MSATKLGPQDMLEYIAQYGVLIYRKCQYAIQKSAVESHLLRHKIYREERQKLMSSISQLKIFEPHEVPLPASDSSPIDGLPVLDGFRCSVDGCGSLFVSSKRMNHHQKERHAGIHPCSAREVKLQTFFRVFEVTEAIHTGMSGIEMQASILGEIEMLEEQEPVQQPLPKPFLTDYETETLTYFYWFNTQTSLTIPCTERPRSASHYWKREVVPLAFSKRWLMCGLLGLSAYHLAVTNNQAMLEGDHTENSSQFFSVFSTGFNEAKICALGTEGSEVEKKACIAGEQIDYVISCIHWNQSPSQLESIMIILRRFYIRHCTLSQDDSHSNEAGIQNEAFERASMIIQKSPPSNSGPLSVLLTRLSALPSRMTEAFGRPENVRDIGDVLTTISDIAILIECCEIGFVSDDMRVALEGMTMWLAKISDRFYQMVSIHDPAALTVLAHWAASLVERAEKCGCWFLEGLARTIILQIVEQLPADKPAIIGLIESLMK
ncbi:hypothetical protein HYALB_00002433 [Hymenoscyphus albidus]|uniref:C2H2-type domain-containing protein n=1 Tax=Hymenoscyphus albidus TaxID=595503 RepID=A0A9N9LQ77_9HELO|nr:hypothetical protein HYALB_00002433 [Hymenoscyphus albidus]